MFINLHEAAITFRFLPSGTQTPGRLAKEVKPAKMTRLAIPCRLLPLLAA